MPFKIDVNELMSDKPIQAAYTVIIELHKNGQFYSSGQFQDPAAFNYPPYGVTP
jgi:hypothetical protein